jgi:F0F1-type ATP synthase membrane subunit b/b'
VKLSIDQAKKRVEEILIAAKRDDHEKAHSLEDKLRREALQIIARGDLDLEGARKLALVALSSEAFVFGRHCS